METGDLRFCVAAMDGGDPSLNWVAKKFESGTELVAIG